MDNKEKPMKRNDAIKEGLKAIGYKPKYGRPLKYDFPLGEPLTIRIPINLEKKLGNQKQKKAQEILVRELSK
jgi:hypothetical protein